MKKMIIAITFLLLLIILFFYFTNQTVKTEEQAINIAREYHQNKDNFTGFSAELVKQSNIWVVAYYDKNSICKEDCKINMSIDAKSGKVIQVIYDE
ncbi:MULTISPECIES: hypothetical protein [Bacillus]|uniref:hypothetical protein n=1 Tax=Bacillus TaxID=1386 RepID=UPI000BB90AF9|nr:MULTISPECIES: hypothetical protein [Bacillus]